MRARDLISLLLLIRPPRAVFSGIFMPLFFASIGSLGWLFFVCPCRPLQANWTRPPLRGHPPDCPTGWTRPDPRGRRTDKTHAHGRAPTHSLPIFIKRRLFREGCPFSRSLPLFVGWSPFWATHRLSPVRYRSVPFFLALHSTPQYHPFHPKTTTAGFDSRY